MTKWVENPTGGRERGPRGLARAWVEVLVRPRRFFRNGVSPGDQAPGLTFTVVVAGVFVCGQLLLAPATVSGYGRIVSATGSVYLSAIVVVAVACFLVAPLVLHLAAALCTLALIPLVEDRGGVGETVQVVGYATAPVVFAAVPVPAVQFLAATYGSVLLVVGLAVVHETALSRAALAGALPALFVFGFAVGGIGAFQALASLDSLRDVTNATDSTNPTGS